MCNSTIDEHALRVTNAMFDALLNPGKKRERKAPCTDCGDYFPESQLASVKVADGRTSRFEDREPDEYAELCPDCAAKAGGEDDDRDEERWDKLLRGEA